MPMAAPMSTDSGVERRPLSLEIHAATRSCHTALNRLITSRLPLCLPPHAINPALYAAGIATLGQIYLMFEQTWDEILAETPGELRMYEALKQLRTLSLSRSARLSADISTLSQRLDGVGRPNAGDQSELAQLMCRTRQAILEKPHLILSYTWVMYMALFNGGRWIRDQLQQGGPEFWGAHKPTPSPTINGLSFWEFGGEHDGEDIKDDFKARFSTAAAALNDTERQEVIEQSVKVFDTCSRMVECLDKQTQLNALERTADIEPQSWLAASYAAASSTMCGIWSGLISAMPSVSIQRSEL